MQDVAKTYLIGIPGFCNKKICLICHIWRYDMQHLGIIVIQTLQMMAILGDWLLLDSYLRPAKVDSRILLFDLSESLIVKNSVTSFVLIAVKIREGE